MIDEELDYYDDSDDLDEDASGGYFPELEEDDDGGSGEDPEEEVRTRRNFKNDEAGFMTKREIRMSDLYDDIYKTTSQGDEKSLEEAVQYVIEANPRHSSSTTVGHIIKEIFYKQGKSRMVNRKYSPIGLISGEDVEIGFRGEDDMDMGFNARFEEEARNQVSRFIEYLANRDLSKDSIVSKRRKQRHIPAFLIFLISSGMYDLIIDCKTLPPVYKEQVDAAMAKITKEREVVVEDLAKRYESEGRPKVAERVRRLGTHWFIKEPAEIRLSAEFADLNLDQDDVRIYKEYRGRYNNVSRSITQDVISDMIEVVEDDGVYVRLKDKTRSDAITDVKQVFKEWSSENPASQEIAEDVLWSRI